MGQQKCATPHSLTAPCRTSTKMSCITQNQYNKHQHHRLTRGPRWRVKAVYFPGACHAFVELWDIRTDKAVQTSAGHEWDINVVQFFPDGQAFDLGSNEATYQVERCQTPIGFAGNTYGRPVFMRPSRRMRLLRRQTRLLRRRMRLLRKQTEKDSSMFLSLGIPCC